VRVLFEAAKDSDSAAFCLVESGLAGSKLDESLAFN